LTIAKPADETPRTAVALAELVVEAGLPPGVFNVVTGIGIEAGAALAEHPGVDHIGFVGSTRIGSVVAHAAADRVVRRLMCRLRAASATVAPTAGSRSGVHAQRSLPAISFSRTWPAS
jgi:acyl-CoA reductase-like NAD-dependent aldehyde dehydrogenase